MEKILASFLEDNTEGMKAFASLHSDCDVLDSTSIYLPKLSRDERAIILTMLPHYNLRGETDQGREDKNSNYVHVIVTKTKDRSAIPKVLLSDAINEYQIGKERFDILESCPPERMIVVDDSTQLTSATLTDRLRAWAGDYTVWRNNDNQIFLLFTDQELRNSALTAINKFGGRKANENDSAIAYASKKANAAHKKAQQQKKREKQLEQQKTKQTANNKRPPHDGWKTVTHTDNISNQQYASHDSLLSGVDLRNKFA
ncbi:hypothetical protein RFI_02180 [Reticulomyxa filosa]|uniref:Uncharacterized protein n=1 Tax=Reticulomyxa filosa TaxID=46433 RepID=X6P9R6_RETFI|nr:hypothetical protein RFI_02180 [Reticulomyxa filosa]|eukprot:ETO34906.1 hypothetical protein RFI_02180 [Reticulomyxa filosa]